MHQNALTKGKEICIVCTPTVIEFFDRRKCWDLHDKIMVIQKVENTADETMSGRRQRQSLLTRPSRGCHSVITPEPSVENINQSKGIIEEEAEEMRENIGEKMEEDDSICP